MPPSEPSLPVLLERLLEAPPHQRDRALLWAVIESGAADAAALWIPGSGGWRAVLERGPRELLPPPAQVRAVLAGSLAAELPLGRAVVGYGHARLALGGVAGEDELDLCEALFVAWSSIAAADVPEVPAAAPAALPTVGGAQELRSLFDAVESARPAFRRLGIGLISRAGPELEGTPPASGERAVYRIVRGLLSGLKDGIARGGRARGTSVELEWSARPGSDPGWVATGSIRTLQPRGLAACCLEPIGDALAAAGGSVELAAAHGSPPGETRTQLQLWLPAAPRARSSRS